LESKNMRNRGDDDDLGMSASITRRDFLSGVLATGAALGTGTIHAADSACYPPAWTGLRGTHVGAFEAAHALAREHKQFPDTAPMADAEYDLIVVGAGISGLAAAFFYRQKNPRARILLLDNHDDFGGHAKRNEFTAGTTHLIGYGGSQSIDGPAHYSRVAKELLATLGIDTQRFYTAFDKHLYSDLGMKRGIAFTAGPFTRSAIVPHDAERDLSPDIIATLPLTPQGRADLQRLYSATDFLPGKSVDERLALLRRTSYLDYLKQTVAVGDEATTLLKNIPNGFWGLNYDALSALEGYRLGQPGFTGLPFSAVDNPYPEDEPYIFHFPDGNASVARALVRRLIPAVAPGDTMTDLVTARFDYARLDTATSPVRIRLNSTALRVAPGPAGCDVIYARGGALERVRGHHCVLACYNTMIPYLMAGVPEEQRIALAEAVRTPLVYTNVAIKNWHAFVAAGVHQVYCPTGHYPSVMLDFPVSLGDYHFSKTPDDPIVVHLDRAPVPGNGAAPVDQFRAGRYELLGTSFEDMERAARAQLVDMFGSHGFDPARDIDAITINRWPHGYAREFNELFDPPPGVAAPFWERARRPIDGVTIANSDAQGKAYVKGAIDAAYRAVNDL
jgi:spermidine dehydrogenase